MVESTNPAAHIETRACMVCGVGFDVYLHRRGRPAIYCGKACNAQACRDRKSAATQERRRSSAKPCEACGGQVPVATLGPVPRWCSQFCFEVSRGDRRAEPLPQIQCALPGCGKTFVPFHDYQRCCSERHGKNLYNRESRADGRQAAGEWNDKRRDAYHRRRALKKSAATGTPVHLAEIAERDGHKCGICKKRVPDVEWPHPLSASLDHMIPLSKGGAHDTANVQLAHLRCNTAKGNRGGGEQLALIG